MDHVERQRAERRERLRAEVRSELKTVLRQLAPGEATYLFGSIVHAGKFHDRSDIDVAFVDEPRACNLYQMQARLEDAMRRPVDLIVLSECRLKEKILREGELWTN
jgi:predicted nucleotidyltransferase